MERYSNRLYHCHTENVLTGFKLGFGEPWESECSSDGKLAKVALVNKSFHLLIRLHCWLKSQS